MTGVPDPKGLLLRPLGTESAGMAITHRPSPGFNNLKKQTQRTQGRQLAWNSLLNVATGLLIVGLNILFVPQMLHAFGREFYGILTMTWMVLANFAWLDFGFSRASARYVAQELALGRPEDAALWAWTAIISQAVLGALGSIVLIGLAPVIVNHIHVQPADRPLVILTLRVFAFAIPIDFANRSIIGVLQAAQRFDWVNAMALAGTLSMFAVYAAGILHRADFLLVVYGLFAVRIVNFSAAYYGATRVLPTLKNLPQFHTLSTQYWAHAVRMIRYGSWVAAVSMIGPLILYCDQSLISVILGISFLPFYTVPFNLLQRLGIFSGSLSSTLFPAFTAMEARTEWGRLDNYFARAHRYLLGVLLPALFVLYLWGPEILRLWIGPEFELKGAVALRILSFGFVIALLAPISGARLEAMGRPDLLFKLYLAEFPFNTAAVWFLTRQYGIAGAALSFTLRSFAETLAIWVILYYTRPFSKKHFLMSGLLRPCLLLVPLAAGAYFIGLPHGENYANIFGTLITLFVAAACGFLLLLDGNERDMFFDQFKNDRLGRIRRRLTFNAPSVE